MSVNIHNFKLRFSIFDNVIMIFCHKVTSQVALQLKITVIYENNKNFTFY